MIKQLKYLTFIAIYLIFSSSAGGADLINKNADGLALRGYDAVSYFTGEGPLEGSERWQTRWNGAIWRFASAKNLKQFQTRPARYAPQYGGYCAYAASYGQLADGDPAVWTVIDDKLYLNFSPRAQAIWLPRAAEFIGDADAQWPGVVEANTSDGE